MKAIALQKKIVGGCPCFYFATVEINGLTDMQNVVEGSIESFDYNEALFQNNIVSYCNDEGKLRHLTPSILVFKNGEMIDTICGNVLFTGINKDGETVDLTDDQIALLKKTLQQCYFQYEHKVIFGYRIDY